MRKSLQKCLIGLFAMGLCLSFSGKTNELKKAAAYKENYIVEKEKDGGKDGSNGYQSPRSEELQLQLAYDNMSLSARAAVTFKEFCDYYYSHDMTIQEVVAFFEAKYGLATINPGFNHDGGMLKPDIPVIISPIAELFAAYNRLNPVAQENVTFAQFRTYYSSHSLTLDQVVAYFNNLYPEIDPDDIPNNPYNDTDWYWWRDNCDVDGVISNTTNCTGGAAGQGFVPMPCYTNNQKKRVYNESNPTEFNVDPEHYDRNPRTPCDDAPYVYVHYDQLQPGDIFWDSLPDGSMNPNNWASHMGMIVSVNQPGQLTHENGFVETFTYVQTIEAVASGVRYGFLDDVRIAHMGVRVLRPNCSQTIKDRAIDFMYAQLGKPYSLTGGTILPTTTLTWYCTQLVYNAYFNAGLDIFSGLPFGVDGFLTNGIFLADTIYDALKNYEVDFMEWREYPCPEIVSVYNDVNEWRVTVRNPLNTFICMSYSPTLYYFGDIVAHFADNNKEMGCEYMGPYDTKTVRVAKRGIACTALFYLAYNGLFHITVVNNDTNLLWTNYYRTYSALKDMYGPHQQIAKDYMGRYQIQLTNEKFGSGVNQQEKYRVPYRPLMTANEAQTYNFNMPYYSELVVTAYGHTYEEYERGTMLFDIRTENNSLTAYNSFAFRTWDPNDPEGGSLIYFNLNKSAGTYTRHVVNYNPNYARAVLLGKSGNFFNVRIYNLTDGQIPVIYNVDTLSLVSNLSSNLNYLTGLATVQVHARSYYDVSIYDRQGYSEILMWTYGLDDNGNDAFLATFGANLAPNSGKMDLVFVAL